MKVGIVICAWNCIRDVKRALASVVDTCRNEGIEFNILLHDDCSEIDPLQTVISDLQAPYTEYVRQHERRGLTAAWNTGINWALSKGMDAVALCNQDIQFVPGWLPRFTKDIELCPGLSPLSNSPGVHSTNGTLQAQDVRNYIEGFDDRGIDPTQENFSFIMDKIAANRPVQTDGIKGFFLGFRVSWLHENRISTGEYYNMKNAYSNRGVGGSENEIFNRTGIKPWIAADFYIHHFRQKGNVGSARELFNKAIQQE